MSGDLFLVAGAKIYIGRQVPSKKVDFVLSDFAGATWTEIDGWETMGEYGDTAEVVSTNLINRKRTIKQTGTVDGGSMANNFAIVTGDAGQLALRAAARSGKNWEFKIVYDDAPTQDDGEEVTITIASPGVVTQAAHGYAAGKKIILSTTGSLPTGLTAGTVYYVVNPATNTYQLAATPGGAAINTTGTQSGVHTATPIGQASEDYFIGIPTSRSKQGGGANTTRMLSVNIEINSNTVEIDAEAA